VTRLQQRIARYIDDYIERGRDIRPQVVADFILHYDCPRSERRMTLDWIQTTYPVLYEKLVEQCPKLMTPRECLVNYTIAPAAYDGFGTEELAIVGTCNGKPLRKVETPIEHVQWQVGRYWSGMHATYDEAGFQDLRTRPWYVAPIEEPVHE
jgi:hypothetical protein